MQNSLQFISCRKIGSHSYSEGDLNIDCDSVFYKDTIFPINTALVSILGLVIPFNLGYNLWKNKKKKELYTYMYQRKFGILYLEYKESSFFWEIYILIEVKNIYYYLYYYIYS